MADERQQNGTGSDPARTGAYPAERVYAYAPPDDEISLFDLWDALVRRRWIIVGVAAAVTLLALAYALAQPDVYRYQVSLKIGQSAEGEPIASPKTTIAALEANAIPMALRQVLDLDAQAIATGDADVPDVNVDSPEGSGIVHIRIEGPEAKAETYREILRTAAGLVVRDQAGVLETEQLRLSRRLEQLAAERERAQEQLTNVNKRIERLAGTDSTGSGAAALRLDALHQRAGELEARIREIAAERDRLSASLEVLRKHEGIFGDGFDADAVERQRRAAREIAALSGGVRPTRVIAPPERSFTGVGTSGRLILALGIVLGGMLGVFAGFVAEFVAAARRRHTADRAP